jgi:uncharacterized membrane protein
MASTYNQISARGLDRIAALSDGLFAIAMTIIVLEIRVPAPAPGVSPTDQDVANAIIDLWPRFVTYLLSFLTLGIFWSAQQTQLNYFVKADRHLAWIHLGFLATVALLPFSTALLADYIATRLAIVVYWANLAVLGVFVHASWTYAARAGLLKDTATAGVSAAIKRRIRVYQGLYALGALLCVINPAVSIVFIVLVQLNSAIAPRLRFLSSF